MCLGCITDKSSHQDVASDGCGTVEYTSELNQLVTLVSATSQQVKHRVDYAVQNTHGETAGKRSDQINQESAFLAYVTAQPLD